MFGLRERTLIVFEGGLMQERAEFLLLGLRKKDGSQRRIEICRYAGRLEP
jgi:hypothetical protein